MNLKFTMIDTVMEKSLGIAILISKLYVG